MYPIAIYLAVGLIDIGFTIYGVLGRGADYYKDLIALGVATFITVYLALAATSGTVIVSDGHVMISSEDGLGNTTTTYSDPSIMQDDGLMWIGFVIAAIQGIFLLFEIVETVEDYYAQKAERLLGGFD
jgi:hypothetical protein